VNAGFRFGVIAGKSTVIGLNLGWSSAFLQLKPRYGSMYVNPEGGNSLETQRVKSLSKASNGLLVGVFAEYSVTKNFVLGFTFNIANIGGNANFKLKNVNINPGSADMVQIKARPVVIQSMISMKYAIPMR
jgi:hypothetical protein